VPDQFKKMLNMRSLCWSIFIISIVLVIGVRLRLLGIPFERDEGEYAYIGQLMLQGVPPYKLAYTMKFPGTHMAYALIMALFGESVQGVHMGLLVVNLATIILVFFISKRLFGFAAAFSSAVSYAFLSLSQSTLGLHAHATHFVIFFFLASILILLRGLRRQDKWIILGSGLLSGMALLMKQHGIFFSFFGFIYLWWDHLQLKTDPILRLSKKLMAYCIGVAVPFLSMCFVFYCAGVFPKFLFWTFNYAGTYGHQMSFSSANYADGYRSLFFLVVYFFMANLIMVMKPFQALWYGAVLGIIFLFINARSRKHIFFLVTLLFVSFFAICPGFVFRSHYFVMILPVISFLIGVSFDGVYSFRQGREFDNFFRTLAVVLFLTALFWSVFQQRNYLFYESPLQVLRDTYPGELSHCSINIGAYIRKESSLKETIAVLGSEPQIYFYAQRHSATGYLYMYPLSEEQPYSFAMEKEVITGIEKSRPQFIIFVHDRGSWGREMPTLIEQWVVQYLHNNYVFVGLVDAASENTTDYYWGKAAAYVTTHPSFIQIYIRKKSGEILSKS